MNSKQSLLLIAFAAIFAVSSCSGLKTPCVTNCGGGGGNASLSLTISDTTPTNANVVSFSLPIIGITLTPSSGSAVSVFSSSTSAPLELTRLQTDTNLIANNVTVAAGTYTAVNVTVAAPVGVYFNNSGSTFGTCVSTTTVSSVCSLSGAAATIAYKFPSALTLTANGNQWLDLDFNYNNAVVTNGSAALAIDVTQANVMTASSTVPTGVASGAFANLDDFTGAVTAISSSSITVESSVRGSITEAINSSTQVFDPQDQCTSGAALSCIQEGSIVSVQGVLTTAGAPTATSLDIIDISTTPSDEVEGIIYPASTSSCSSGLALILSDSEIFTSGSPLASAGFGSGVCLTITSSPKFAVDSDYLFGQAGLPTVTGFSSTSDLISGQMIRTRVSGATTTNDIINATANVLLLRFSRITGTVSAATSTSFTVSGLPSYLGTSFPSGTLVQAYQNATLVEGQSSLGNLTGTVSMSALYLNGNDGLPSWFYAAKVRQQQ